MTDIAQLFELNQEHTLEEGTATHSSILAWRILWSEKPGGLWSIGSQRVRHNWSDWACTHIIMVFSTRNPPGTINEEPTPLSTLWGNYSFVKQMLTFTLQATIVWPWSQTLLSQVESNCDGNITINLKICMLDVIKVEFTQQYWATVVNIHFSWHFLGSQRVSG